MYNDENSICCSICLENVCESDDNSIKQFNCNHIHHIKCLKKWSGSCPDCRSTHKTSLKGTDYIKLLKSIHKHVPKENQQIYLKSWEKKECITQNHKITFLKPYGVIGFCECCSSIQAYNLMH